MIIIGITGQSGGGKSFLSDEFKKLGYIHMDADKIYHSLLDSSKELCGELVREFGSDILTDEKIDRKKLAKKVFGKKNSRKLQRLNKIAHKYVCRESIKLIISAKEKGEKGVLIDAPLLIEARLHLICDTCICVICSEEIRIKRIMERDKISYEEARLRISSQKPVEFYTSKCDRIFIGDGTQDAERFAKDTDNALKEKTDE